VERFASWGVDYPYDNLDGQDILVQSTSKDFREELVDVANRYRRGWIDRI
jgi:hypothetical protein